MMSLNFQVPRTHNLRCREAVKNDHQAKASQHLLMANRILTLKSCATTRKSVLRKSKFTRKKRVPAIVAKTYASGEKFWKT